jgi:hypothetical protein
MLPYSINDDFFSLFAGARPTFRKFREISPNYPFLTCMDCASWPNFIVWLPFNSKDCFEGSSFKLR